MMQCPCSTRSGLAETPSPQCVLHAILRSTLSLQQGNSSLQCVPRAAPVALSIASCGGGDQSVSRFGLAVRR